MSPGIGKRKMRDDDVVCATSALVDEEVKDFIKDSSMIDKMETMDSSKLHDYLKLIDPTMANRLHPNNKRKIMR